MGHARADLSAGGQIPNVPLHKGKTAPSILAHHLVYHVQIFLVAGEKIVESDHALSQLQETFKQIGANKAGHARYEPPRRLGRHVLPEIVIRAHSSILLTV